MYEENIMVRVCKDCGTIYSEKTERCESCGTRLSEPMENEKAIDWSKDRLRDKAEISQIIEDSRMSDGREMSGIVHAHGKNYPGRAIGAWIVFGAFMPLMLICKMILDGSGISAAAKRMVMLIIVAVLMVITVSAIIGEILLYRRRKAKMAEKQTRVCEACGEKCGMTGDRCENCGAEFANAEENVQPEPKKRKKDRPTSLLILGILSLSGAAVTAVSLLMKLFRLHGFGSVPLWLWLGVAATSLVGFVTAAKSFACAAEKADENEHSGDLPKIIGMIISLCGLLIALIM